MMRKRGVFAAIVILVLILAPSACSQTQPHGKVQIAFADEIDKAAYKSMDEKIIGKEDDMAAIFTDGLLQGLVLEYGEMDMEGIQFAPDEKIFDLHQLTDDHRATVKTYFGDVDPTLRLSFDGAESREEYFLFQSGEDGSTLLLPADDFLSPKA